MSFEMLKLSSQQGQHYSMLADAQADTWSHAFIISVHRYSCRKIPWMEEPGRLQSMGSLRVGHNSDFTFTFHFHALEKEMATHSRVLAWKIPGTEEPGGLPSMGSHRVGHD